MSTAGLRKMLPCPGSSRSGLSSGCVGSEAGLCLGTTFTGRQFHTLLTIASLRATSTPDKKKQCPVNPEHWNRLLCPPTCYYQPTYLCLLSATGFWLPKDLPPGLLHSRLKPPLYSRHVRSVSLRPLAEKRTT